MVKKTYVTAPRADASGYSLAVTTHGGGRIVWLAGHVAAGVQDTGATEADDFESQVRSVFANLQHTLEQAGGSLADLVTMTVYLTDVANQKAFTRLRREILGKDFPGSASLTVKALALPSLQVEIQGIAVLD